MVPCRSRVLFAVWAAVMLAASVHASGHRALLQGGDALGLHDCGLEPDAAALAANCPHDGQRYQVCLLGPSKGGCRLESAGLFIESQCNTICATTQSAG